MRDMETILAATLNIYIARVPVAVFGCGLGTPMCPDAELGVTEPFGTAIGGERLASADEAGSRCGCGRFESSHRLGGVKSWRGSGEEFDGGSSVDGHIRCN